MEPFRIKKRTVSEENGQNGSFLRYRSEAFGGGDVFASDHLRRENPIDIAERLEEMADHLAELRPSDADPEDVLKQIQRLREEADAIRKGGVNVFDD